MIPAKLQCPPYWTREYYGYLMSAYFNDPRSTYECIDSDAEAVRYGAGYTVGALFYFVESRCEGIACPPYAEGRELSCTVCTK